MVLDVRHLSKGDVKVGVKNHRLVVEGKVQKSEEGGSSVSTNNFQRSFDLPPDVDMSKVTPVCYF